MDVPEKTTRARRVTLRDVAILAGAHVGTVLKALAGAGAMTEATRARIRAAAEKLGYTPDPMLRALANYRNALREESFHGTLAWLLLDQDRDPITARTLAALWADAEAAARKMGYRLEAFRREGLPPGRLEAILRARGIAGLLIPPLRLPGQSLEMDFAEFAVVAIGSSIMDSRPHRVQPQQYLNMRRLLQALRERGYRRIGFCLHRRLDERTQSAYSAGFWIEQRAWPPAERSPLALLREDAAGGEAAFRKWFKAHCPDHLIGIPGILSGWCDAAGFPRIPISFFGDPRFGYLPEQQRGGILMDEQWPIICARALRMLDDQIRHGERGPTTTPMILEIPGALTRGGRRIVERGMWDVGKSAGRRPGFAGATPGQAVRPIGIDA